MAEQDKTAPPDEDVCPKCFGSGVLIEDGVCIPCDCGAWAVEGFRQRHSRARIPKRFGRKTLKAFRAPKNDTVRTTILHEARAYVSMFAENPERGLLLVGGTGSGKTHVAVGILIEVLRQGFTGVYYNVTDLLSDLRSTFDSRNDLQEATILDEVASVDLLVLDDLGAEKASDWVRDRLYLIVNTRYEAEKATIITTNCDDLDLKERVGPRIVSRTYEMCTRFHPFPHEDYRAAHMH